MSPPLRVLHVNTYDLEGGAARAAHRIHRALRGIGVDSHMLVLNRREHAPHVLQPLSQGRRAIHRIKLAASTRLMTRQHTPSNPTLHSLNCFSSGLADWINRSNFDIVNLHWLGGEMLSVEEIGRIRKPICWTMHDMWPFCGAEHYDDLDHPGRYQETYERGNRPQTYDGPDLDAWVWRRKRKAWANQRFQLISPSRWLAGCAGQSTLLGHQSCTVIPNCVDTEAFKPINRGLARSILNLDADKRYVLFGAMSSTSDRRKGFHLLEPALQRLAELQGIKEDTELLVFGATATNSRSSLEGKLPIHYLGNFYDDASLCLLYSAADVFVAPSMQDNLPNTLVESLSCGTPCVAFSVGGMSDLIEDHVTGHLAEVGRIEDLTAQILQALSRPLDRAVIRNKALMAYGAHPVAEKYRHIYLSMDSLSSSNVDGHSTLSEPDTK